MLEILRYLPIDNRCRVRRVCKTWNRIVSDNSLWRHVDLLEYRLDLRTMWKFVRTHFSPCLLTMKIQGYAQAGNHKRWRALLSDSMLKELAACCPNLWLLHLHDCRTNNLSFESLPPSITCLKIVSTIWRPRWIKDKQKHLAKLEHLTLDKSVRVDAYDLEDIAFWKNLKRLSLMGCSRIGKTHVETFAYNFTELELLNLSGTNINHSALHDIAHYLKKLKELYLAGIQSVNDEIVACIAEGLPVLNKLDLSYCEFVSLEGLESLCDSRLAVLIFKHFPALSEKDVQGFRTSFPANFILII
ncbi:unnamed protein product [Candidula unifasciata]|uniref:F-box domain-containing protein n=1 Tax=Candidula unifasciata TaxID=100452 RepID=A0A8S3YSL8_9EUPU|nr:unnamed protein product [Candidula unifasciata]